MSELLVEAKNEGVFKGIGNLDCFWEIAVNIRYLLFESIYSYRTNICNALLRHDICPKLYTAKVRNLRHLFLQINRVNASNINNLGIFLL